MGEGMVSRNFFNPTGWAQCQPPVSFNSQVPAGPLLRRPVARTVAPENSLPDKWETLGHRIEQEGKLHEECRKYETGENKLIIQAMNGCARWHLRSKGCKSYSIIHKSIGEDLLSKLSNKQNNHFFEQFLDEYTLSVFEYRLFQLHKLLAEMEQTETISINQKVKSASDLDQFCGADFKWVFEPNPYLAKMTRYYPLTTHLMEDITTRIDQLIRKIRPNEYRSACFDLPLLRCDAEIGGGKQAMREYATLKCIRHLEKLQACIKRFQLTGGNNE